MAGHAFRHLAPGAPAAAARLTAVHEVSAVTAACLAVRREVFDEVGGFDEALTITPARFLSKWGAEALSDPFYSPHLTLAREDGAPRDICVRRII